MTIFFRVDVAASLFAILAGALHIGAYFGFWWSAPETGMELFWRVGVSVALMIVMIMLISIVTSITDKTEMPTVDERESRVQFKAMRNMLYMYSGGLAIIFMEAFDGLTDPMALAHAVIGVFVVGELIRLPSLWWYLRQPA